MRKNKICQNNAPQVQIRLLCNMHWLKGSTLECVCGFENMVLNFQTYLFWLVQECIKIRKRENHVESSSLVTKYDRLYKEEFLGYFLRMIKLENKIAVEIIKQSSETKGFNRILKRTSNLLQTRFQNWQTTVKRFKNMTWPTTVRKKPNVQHLWQAKLLKPSSSLPFYEKKFKHR